MTQVQQIQPEQQGQAQIIQAIHIHLEGSTAFFRLVWTASGTQLTIPCPPYSTLLGLISCCSGRIVTPQDTRIGYEFSSVSEGEELERTNRFAYDNGRLKEHPEGQYYVKRKIHFSPKLDLYLTNLSLAEAFYNPIGTPHLGRSQDICCITKVEQVSLTRVQTGMIGSTLIRNEMFKLSNNKGRYVSAELVSCVEYYDNEVMGELRKVKAKGLFQVLQPNHISNFSSNPNTRMNITASNLYHPSNLPSGHVIYLHEWSSK